MNLSLDARAIDWQVLLYGASAHYNEAPSVLGGATGPEW